MSEPRAIVPDKGIRPGLNATGVEIAKSVCVQLESSGEVDTIALPAAGGPIYGVTAEVIPVTSPNTRGDVQVDGRAVVLVGAGGVTQGDALQATATGAVILAAAADIVIGVALTTAADTEFAEVELVGAAQGRIVP